MRYYNRYQQHSYNHLCDLTVVVVGIKQTNFVIIVTITFIIIIIISGNSSSSSSYNNTPISINTISSTSTRTSNIE